MRPCCDCLSRDGSFTTSLGQLGETKKLRGMVPVGGVLGAALAALVAYAARPQLEQYFSLYLHPYQPVLVPFMVVGGIGIGLAVDYIAQRCFGSSLRSDHGAHKEESFDEVIDFSSEGKERTDTEAPVAVRAETPGDVAVRVPPGPQAGVVAAPSTSPAAVPHTSTPHSIHSVQFTCAREHPLFQGKEMEFLFTKDTVSYDAVRMRELSPLAAEKLSALTQAELKTLCGWEEFWELADSLSPGALHAAELRTMASFAVEDSNMTAIHVLNRILARLQDNDPDLEDKLAAIASCGHPSLWESVLLDKGRMLDRRAAAAGGETGVAQSLADSRRKAEQAVFCQLDDLPGVPCDWTKESIGRFADKLSALGALQLQHICSCDRFWSLFDVFSNYEQLSQPGVELTESDVRWVELVQAEALPILHILSKTAVWDPKGRLIRVINGMLAQLDGQDPLLKEKLAAIAGCGHPQLNTALFEAKCWQLDGKMEKKGNCFRGLQSTYAEAMRTCFRGMEEYLAKIPTTITPSLVEQELQKTLPPLLSKLTPAAAAFLCIDAKFWALIQHEYIFRLAHAALSPESLGILAYFTVEDPRGERIYAINRIMVELSDEDPRLEAKLLALAACGNPRLEESKLSAKGRKLDQKNRGRDGIRLKIIKTWKDAKAEFARRLADHQAQVRSSSQRQ